MPITIAPARPDRPEIAALIAQLDAYLGRLYPAESNHLLPVAQMLAANVHFLAARRDGLVLGIGALVIEPDYGEIKRLYVPARARGQGIAQRLMTALIDQARASRLGLLRLETGIHQPEALALFGAMGFVAIGRFGAYRDDPLSIFMERVV